MIKTWPKTKLKNIPFFLSFVNFYQRFTKNFGKIAALLTPFLKTILRSRIIIVKKLHKACDDKIDFADRAFYKKKKRSNECVNTIITKIPTNFLSPKA